MITDVVCDKLLNAMNKITFPTAQVLLDLEQKQHSITVSTQMFHVGSLELRTDSQPYARRHPRAVGQRHASDDQFLSKPTGPRRCPPERNVLNNLTSIGESAFYNCIKLTTVTADKLESINDKVFGACFALTTVSTNNLTSIGTSAFIGCAKLTTVNAENLKSIGQDAFARCSANIIVSDMTSPIFTTLSALDEFRGTIEFKTHQDEAELAQLRTKFTDVLFINPSALSVSHSGGDPYVYPVVGPCYKLPNCEEVYRLYQDDHVVVNARVSVASPQIQAEIVDAVLVIGCDFMTPVSTEAYFYSHVVIASRTTDDRVLIDLAQKQHCITGSTQMFHVGNPELRTDSRPYEPTVKSHVGIPVRWGNDMCLTISFSRNPQVRNGVRLSGTFSTEAAGGLLVRNYRPKLFRLSDSSSRYRRDARAR